jgi:hypothetical protein
MSFTSIHTLICFLTAMLEMCSCFCGRYLIAISLAQGTIYHIFRQESM